jgi:hypothetical protein
MERIMKDMVFDFALRQSSTISASVQGRRAVEEKKVRDDCEPEESKQETLCTSSSRLECIKELESERIVTFET